MNLLWTPQALRDRDKQAARIATDSPRAAIEQIDLVEHQVDALLTDPYLGRSGRIHGTRELVIARTPFVVVYRIRTKPERIEVLRMLHGAQQWPPQPSR